MLYNKRMGNEENTSPEFSTREELIAKAREERWKGLSSDLLALTRKEISGNADPSEIEDAEDLRVQATTLFQQLGKTNFVQAATLGLVDCVPEGEWDELRKMHIGDERDKRAIEHFYKKRTQASKPPQS